MNPRIPPSGPFVGIMRVSLSDDVAFLDGVAINRIPFDRLDFRQGDVGELQGDGSIAIGPGLYLAQMQLRLGLGAPLDLASMTLTITSFSDGERASLVQEGLPDGSQPFVVTQALRVPTETSLPPAFAAVIGSFQGDGEGGNLVGGSISPSSLLLWKLADTN